MDTFWYILLAIVAYIFVMLKIAKFCGMNNRNQIDD